MKTELYKVLEEASSNTQLEPLTRLLALDNPVWRAALCRLASSSRCVSAVLPDEPEMDSVYGIRARTKEDDRMVLSAEGPPMASTSGLDVPEWPYDPEAVISYDSDTTIRLSVGGLSVPVRCWPGKDRVVVTWPMETGLQGDLRLLDGESYGPGFSVKVTLRPSYPAYAVAGLVKEDMGAYDLLEHAGYVEAFCRAAEPSEKIAIAVLAVYMLQTGKRKTVLNHGRN